jgi:hypothetical protein
MKRLSKTQFFLLSFTWGLPMTLIGLIVALILIIMGYKPQRNYYGYVFKVGTGWGGISLGPFSIVNNYPTSRTLRHEFGHSVQNCYFGLFMPLFVAIPSCIRYWWRNYLIFVKHYSFDSLPPYDSIWFEGQATKIGNWYWDV